MFDVFKGEPSKDRGKAEVVGKQQRLDCVGP